MKVNKLISQFIAYCHNDIFIKQMTIMSVNNFCLHKTQAAVRSSLQPRSRTWI